jgi:integrase
MSEFAHDLLEEVAEGVIVRPMLTLNDAIDVFLASGFKDTTRARYSRVLDTFADRFPRTWDVAKVKESDCLSFLAGYSHRTPGHRGYIEKVLSSFFKHLYLGHQIKQNPMDRIKRTRQPSPEDLDVKTLSSREVVLMLEAAETLSEQLCVAVLAYLGPRRRALALLRVKDYDRDGRRLRFHEKGGKTIWKPVPDELAVLLDARLNEGGSHAKPPFYGREDEGRAKVAGAVLEVAAPRGGKAEVPALRQDDYLIPPEGPLLRQVRDDRVIWRLVKKVAERAGVDAHPHAIRAAFAVYYLETRGRDIVGLQELMGHESSETTKVYLRKMDKALAMEPVRGLSWGTHKMSPDPVTFRENGAAANTGNGDSVIGPQFAGNSYPDSVGVGAGGFEPPYQAFPEAMPPLSLQSLIDDLDPLKMGPQVPR